MFVLNNSIIQLTKTVNLRQAFVVYLAKDYLWSQIFWGATQCPGPALYSFGKAKICYL